MNNDIISRKALLDEMDKWICDFPDWKNTTSYRRGFERAMAIVDAAPAVDVTALVREQKPGLLKRIFGGKKRGE